MAVTDHVSYEEAALSEAEIRAGLGKLMGSLSTDEDLRSEVQKEGGNPSLLYANRDEAIEVSSEGAGFGAETVILIKLAVYVGQRLWDKVLEPRLLDLLGQDALGKRREKS
jgi:hypothetical protein